jgi:NADH-quinone oxidoreductase subunit N
MRFDLALPSHLLGALGPDLFLAAGAMWLLLWAAWGPETARRQRSVGAAAMVVTLGTIVLVFWYMTRDYTTTVGPIATDLFRWSAALVLLVATLGALALSIDYNEREGIDAAESHVLILFATGGMMILAAARDLIIVFLGIEIMSVAVYVLAGMNRRSGRSAEAALKYFLLGAFSTAFLLYGIALIYGATASTNLQVIAARLLEGGPDNPMLLIGIGLLIVGFAFKVAVVPFHMWAPDVYEGAPTPVTAYMAAAVKTGGFVVFMRVWLEALQGTATTWHFALWWLAAFTMVVGNVVALAQRNIKRLLAYSSIAHGGYILVALVATGPRASGALLFYLFAYTLATVGAFAVVGALSGTSDRYEAVDDYAGLWNERPWIAVAMGVFMLALLGFPVFGGAGFFAKWYIIQAALQGPSPQARLAILLVVTSVISAGYYLYVVMVMFMRPRPEDRPAAARVLPATGWVIGAAAVLILAIGFHPSPLANLARRSLPRPPVLQPADTAAVTPRADAPGRAGPTVAPTARAPTAPGR